MAKMTRESVTELRDSLRKYYEDTLESNIWKKIGINHVTYLHFMYPEHSNNEPLYKTCAKVKRFLDANKKDN